jgi:hypothetical protein
MPTYKDPRLKAIGLLHKNKYINTFDDIWESVPRTLVANELHIGTGRFGRLTLQPGGFTYNEISAMAKLFEMEFKTLSKMVEDAIK